jgi:hypothetical protein
MQYGTTSDFLRCFGLKSIEELPSASEELVNMFEKTREKEEEERSADQEQMTIDEIETENTNDNSEQNTESQDSIVLDNTNQEPDSSEIPDEDEPSAEDDIIVD